MLVQRLLAQHYTHPGPTDGLCGPRTVHAILNFQARFLSMPDGRVDPHGTTWRHLQPAHATHAAGTQTAPHRTSLIAPPAAAPKAPAQPQALGLGNMDSQMMGMGAQLLTLKFSREDESESDLVGMELAARAGYDSRAGVSLWQKMAAASKGAPPQFLSTHPSGPTRISNIENNLPRATPLYTRAKAGK